jgi:hypothetical protein
LPKVLKLSPVRLLHHLDFDGPNEIGAGVPLIPLDRLGLQNRYPENQQFLQ